MKGIALIWGTRGYGGCNKIYIMCDVWVLFVLLTHLILITEYKGLCCYCCFVAGTTGCRPFLELA